MEVLIIAVIAGVGFITAYHTYGKWLGSKIFRLSAKTVCPSCRLKDGIDYVPTSKSVVFGHHFTSIAGTGPIVGPAIAIMWGWVPALLWVIFGSIFIGAVHDFGALVVSLRNNGQTVGEIAGRVMNRRVRLLFLFVLFLALTVVLAIFGLVIAAVFKQYPSAIFPCMIQIPLAVAVGIYLHRNGTSLLLPSLAVLGIMYLTVIFGNVGVLGQINMAMAAWSIWQWVVLLLAYSYVASVLPVWTLLQPRDFINSLQLLSALGLIVVGLAVAAFFGGAPLEDGVRPSLEIAAPMVKWHPEGAPMIFPFLFITIACGAISGFHCMVSSGTSSKQVQNEEDARFIGYGSMLTEAFLAILVILACVAGLGLGISGESGDILTGSAAWESRYVSWGAAGSLGAKVGAFVDGAGNFLKALGIPAATATALMGVFVASFAATTLDTACRLQRYVVQELAGILSSIPALKPLKIFENRHAATCIAVLTAMSMAAVPPTGSEWTFANAGKGGLILWPLFGATNQLLAGLSFMVISFYLWRRKKPVWFIILPMVFMLIMPLWAMLHQLFVSPGWVGTGDWVLVTIGLLTIALEVWMIIEGVLMFPRARGVLEENALDQLSETVPASPPS
ncbi:MAG TPA: carbon starvation protein A [Verrucomicrobiales bacterium]|nr:carbon starvation protein A [Verrucomicrobiales bacterium]HIL71864.1 carbon starvation protein A [Verrucomicrobiota bacterium]